MKKRNPGIPALANTADDKVFIFKENHSAVYIERNRKSVIYKNLVAANVNGNGPGPFEIFNRSGLAKEWVPLCLYKGNYYLYADRDVINMGKRTITERFFSYSDKRGLKTNQLQSFTRLDHLTWSFDFLDTDCKTVIIHIIDNQYQVAVWEDTSIVDDEMYKLYVPKENARHFDMIVDSSTKSGAAGFKFDTPDYDKLLKKLTATRIV